MSEQIPDVTDLRQKLIAVCCSTGSTRDSVIEHLCSKFAEVCERLADANKRAEVAEKAIQEGDKKQLENYKILLREVITQYKRADAAQKRFDIAEKSLVEQTRAVEVLAKLVMKSGSTGIYPQDVYTEAWEAMIDNPIARAAVEKARGQ